MINKRKSTPDNILILAGEHSGDLLGGELVHELRKIAPSTAFFGVGGKEMIQEGVESFADIEQMTVIGFSGILAKYGFLKRLLDRLTTDAIRRKTVAAILIDYPGFNLRLAANLKKAGIPVIYYVSPQIWAWKFKRIFKIKETVNLMMTLFRFEEELYKQYNVHSVFVGHPVMYRIPARLKEEKKIKPSKQMTIALMPGSRSGEIRRHLLVMLDAAFLIQKSFHEKIRFIIPNVNEKEEEYLQSEIRNYSQKHDLNLEYCFNCSLRTIESSKLVILASGTATLEVTWFAKPMIIIYKISWLTWILGKLLVKSKFIGLVNILSGKETCKELIQSECNPENIRKEALRILNDKKYHDQMIKTIKDVKKNLTAGVEPSIKAASEIKKLIGLKR